VDHMRRSGEAFRDNNHGRHAYRHSDCPLCNENLDDLEHIGQALGRRGGSIQRDAC
jgi:hypothetical protein